MEIPSFFERDRDEFVYCGITYLDYFNLYPNLWFEPTLKHLECLENVLVLGSDEDSEGWRIAARFCEINFLLSSHYHGSSTLFCVERGVTDIACMLAFLGCFAPTLRDDWWLAERLKYKKANWIRELLGRIFH